ncbi:MAG: hypothetical protein ACYCY7_14875, partial [Gallionella sp.]
MGENKKRVLNDQGEMMDALAFDVKRFIWLALSAIALRFLHTLAGALILTWAANAAAVSSQTTDLGTLGGTYSEARSINDSGQVVGYSTTAGDANGHAFLYTPGSGMVDIGTLGGTYSEARSINDSGQVVGYSTTAGNANGHAFLYTPGSGMMDLGTLGGTYRQAR